MKDIIILDDSAPDEPSYPTTSNPIVAADDPESSAPPPSGKSHCCQVTYYSNFFDVSTSCVLQRFKMALTPLHSDGSFW